MKIPVFSRLYVRLWLAVVLAVLLLASMIGVLLRTQSERMHLEPPARQIVIKDAAGQVLMESMVQPVRVPGAGLDFKITLPASLQAGQEISLNLISNAPGMGPPPPRRNVWWQPGWLNPGGPAGATRVLLFLLAVFATAVALGSYPVVRRLTKRLEQLQAGVERLAAGDLRARVAETGHDEVAFLAQRFNHAADRIESLVQSNKSLLANASHELRSPLARIRMGLELMGASASTNLKVELTRNINELDALVDEILLASRLDAARQQQAHTSGAAESVDMVALAAEEGARVGVELSVTPGLDMDRAQIQGDAKLLRRLIRNLLENAKRYGGSGEIELTLSASDRPAQLRLEVADHGPGVPAAERERIFEPFYRSSLASESSGGVGLGLALVKSIVTQHGGQVRCLARSDTPASGARFVVDLPTQQAQLDVN